MQIFLLFSIIWYCRIQSPTMSKQQDVRWCSFRWSIPLSIDNVWDSYIDRVISTPSWSYCIWNRWCENHRRILLNFVLFKWYDTVELIDCHVQTTRFTMIDFNWSISISIDNVWSFYIDRAISAPWYSYYMCNSYIKIITGNYHHAGIDLSCRTVVKR